MVDQMRNKAGADAIPVIVGDMVSATDSRLSGRHFADCRMEDPSPAESAKHCADRLIKVEENAPYRRSPKHENVMIQTHPWGDTISIPATRRWDDTASASR